MNHFLLSDIRRRDIFAVLLVLTVLSSLNGCCALDPLRCGGEGGTGRDSGNEMAPIVTAGSVSGYGRDPAGSVSTVPDFSDEPNASGRMVSNGGAASLEGQQFYGQNAQAQSNVVRSHYPAGPASDSAIRDDRSRSSIKFPSAANMARAAELSRASGGDAVVVVAADGRVLFENFGQAAGIDQPHRLASGTKTFWGLLAVAAAQDGLIDLDERVADTIQEWQSDPRKSRITVRQLLHFTSGLDPATKELQGNPESGDKFALALRVPAVAEPGTTFAYGPSHLFVFGAWLKRKLAAQGRDPDPLAYLHSRLLDPIGLEVGHWVKDAAGNPRMPSGAHLAPRQWVKLGQLIANRGVWQGRTLIEPAYLDQMFRGSSANPAYGLTVWLNRPFPSGEGQLAGMAWIQNRLDNGYIYHAGPSDLIMAAGQGGQRLFVIPSRKLIILRTGNSKGASWLDHDFLSILLDGQESTGSPHTPGGENNTSSAPTSAFRSSREDLRRACNSDAQRLCPQAIGDWGMLKECYRARRNEFSTGCRAAVKEMRLNRTQS
ncbi:serine hydrolase domain-containing protein [Thiorhodovibrio frisius]|uniref:serine hydrolase domain-containing protein n=1 Tax=Thiorhodovibrio frisius TaxID=631362 RepID=UPI00167F59AC|nr:serine hydrolase [Thiorhodovibrio frisius]